jgi:hypothetical protein
MLDILHLHHLALILERLLGVIAVAERSHQGQSDRHEARRVDVAHRHVHRTGEVPAGLGYEAAGLVDSVFSVQQFDHQIVDESARNDSVSLCFGQLELRVLMAEQRLPEGHSFLDVRGGQLDGPLHGGDRIARDPQSLPRQLRHELVEASALVSTKQIVGRHPDAIEE